MGLCIGAVITLFLVFLKLLYFNKKFSNLGQLFNKVGRQNSLIWGPLKTEKHFDLKFAIML